MCLRPTLRRAEYKELADELNKKVAWSFFGIEALLYLITCIVLPPFAGLLMVGVLVLPCVCASVVLIYAYILAEVVEWADN